MDWAITLFAVCCCCFGDFKPDILRGKYEMYKCSHIYLQFSQIITDTVNEWDPF